MTELLTWSVDLGRWAGARLRVHYLLLLSLAFSLVFSIGSTPPRFFQTAAWLAIYAGVLALHELGHLVAAAWRQSEPEDILLWQLGNLVGPSNQRSNEDPVVAAGGLISSGVLAVATALILAMFGVSMQLNPFGGELDSGAPYRVAADGTHEFVAALTLIWAVGWFGWLNWVIFLVNLLPALPFDMGRVLRATVARPGLGLSRDAMIGPWAAHVVAILLGVIGLLRMVLYGRWQDALTLILLAFFIELIVRVEARMMEDGSFFDEGVFGYDFSEGYTSLESSAAKVRPYRESALKRWRRKRSEVRRQRRQAQLAAEERRLDEILDKIHHSGRSSLTDEENRFLVRVSANIKKRPRDRA
jgi:stage IV sporulation protein FB